MRYWLGLFCILSLFCVRAQSFEWGRTPGGIGNDAATGLVHDQDGNVYVCGNIAGNAEFNGTTYSHYELFEAFVAKYTPDGQLDWVALAGGHGVDKANAICRDVWGNIWVTGYFEDTAWFGSVQVISKGDKDVFLAKYNASGGLLGVWSYGGPETDLANAITSDTQGNVYVTGSFEDLMFFENMSLNTTNLFSETFVFSVSGNGEMRWAKKLSGTSSNQGTGIASNAANEVGISGFFSGNLSFQNSSLVSDGPSFDAFVLVLDMSGNLIWVRKAGGSYEDAANAIASTVDDHWIVTGYFSGNAYFGNQLLNYYDYNDIFVASYSSSGDCLWAKKMGGYKLDFPGGLSTDPAGNILVTGFFENQAEFGGDWITGIDRDCFVACLDNNGNHQWEAKGGGVQADVGLSVTSLDGNTLWIAGYYLHTCAFGDVSLDYAQNNDAFILKMSAPITGTKDINDNFSVKFSISDNHLYVLNKPEGSLMNIFDIQGKLVISAYNDKISLKGIPLGSYIARIGAISYRFYYGK